MSSTRPKDELEGSLLPPSPLEIEKVSLNYDSEQRQSHISTAVPIQQENEPIATDSLLSTGEGTIVPSYAMASSQRVYRDNEEEAQINRAEGMAQFREAEGRILDEQGRAGASCRVRMEDDDVRRANEVAERRDVEGVQLRTDRWFHDGKHGKEHEESSDTGETTGAGGYEITPYETTEYSCREYACDYEYKSMYE